MDTLTQLIADLVSIDSTNPDLVPGGKGEGEIARFAAGWLAAAGLDVHLEEVKPGRPNVIAVARGSGGGKTLMLNGHIDAVGTGGMSAPFQPAIREDKLYGRGAFDMKAGLAALMTAAAAAAKENLHGDVIFTGVIDEEYAGLGTLDAAQKYHADAAVIAEPTEMEMIIAHRGFIWLEIESLGIAAHGSRPDLGVDAIMNMGPVLNGLNALNRQLLGNPTHALLKSGSLHASIIQGGQEGSTYPGQCSLLVERRTIPGETPQQVEAEIQAILDQTAALDPQFRAGVRCTLVRSPMETPPDSLVAVLTQQIAGEITGRPVQGKGIGFWTDAASLKDAGIPSILFGPAGGGAHADEEWADLPSVKQCEAIYLRLIKEFCK